MNPIGWLKEIRSAAMLSFLGALMSRTSQPPMAIAEHWLSEQEIQAVRKEVQKDICGSLAITHSILDNLQPENKE